MYPQKILTPIFIGGTVSAVKVSFDAAKVFAGPAATWLDDRFDYDEARWLTAGFLAGRVVLVAWTQRGASRRVISMRYCHAKEVRRFRRRFPQAFGDEAG
jgi:uncharacterized DUF497 family protein